MIKLNTASGFLIAGVLLSSCGSAPTTTDLPVTSKAEVLDIIGADDNLSDWLSYGRTYSEQRFSPLKSINRKNVGELKLAWYADLDTSRGQEATPLVIDGKIYTSTAWSHVKAYDARTGKDLWSYDPQVPGKTGVKACCDVVNRGLAAWNDKLYVGTLDGRLIALDRKSGKEVWSATTFETDTPYTITGAPRVMNGMVIIGNGGADVGPARGFVTAYDAETGKQLWRFYTVPDNPANGPQPDYLEAASETWNGEWWKMGGGGTVWDAMAYDPELDLLYIGVGNGAPWNQQFRSPGGGDNLYLSSIVAIKAKTGEYAWHFQTTPGETWDFTATQHIMLADMEIEGQSRKVLMQAPKNGFFYVLDRETGEFISAENYTNVTWAKGIDPETGRPVENPKARYREGPAFVSPGSLGGHNWHPMAYNPVENLVYIPAQNVPQPYSSPETFVEQPLGWNTAVGRGTTMPEKAKNWPTFERETQSGETSPEPDPASYQPVKPRKLGVAALVAWDPATQSERWHIDYPGIWNGGVLATGGGLVFQGIASGEFRAYNSSTGDQLWSFPTQTGTIAAPMTFELDGDQYVAVLAGWGGVYGLLSGVLPNRSRLLVFRLDGTAELPEPSEASLVLDPPVSKADAETIKLGGEMYSRYCQVCHTNGAVLPDLNYSGALENESTWMAILRDGALEPIGMVGFSEVMTDDELGAIRHYLIDRANKAKAKADATSN